MLEYCYFGNMLSLYHLFLAPQSALLRKASAPRAVGWLACDLGRRRRRRRCCRCRAALTIAGCSPATRCVGVHALPTPAAAPPLLPLVRSLRLR